MGLVDVLRFEMRRLRQEESGVALMLTLSVFLLLYVVCAGVYSIGETVRQKIELQNACDSAAYSAAVAQADGLSRMAMINRAMSWTYVQLTNMQIDFITYQWLSLVCKRYYEDLDMCRQNCSASFGGPRIPAFPPLIDVGSCQPHGSEVGAGSIFEDAGTGYFCGVAGVGLDCVRLNGAATPTRVKDIADKLSEVSSEINAYGSLIPQYKYQMGFYNAELRQVMTNMLASISGTAAAILYENLPRKSEGGIDNDLRRDFLGHVGMTYPKDPYLPDGGGYFSPLFNTELGERLFLTMADGEVYDELADYFVDDVHRGITPRFGGLDQWFVRSYEAESAEENKTEIPKREFVADLYNNSISSLGICRVYKNTNRVGEKRTDKFGRQIKYRDHHHAVGDDDSMPSCINTHENCPEQCATVGESIALYADYEWSAGQYECNCTHLHKIVITPSGIEIEPFIHIHDYSWNFIGNCTGGHQCNVGSGQSHSRRSYRSCVATSHSGVIIPDTPTAVLMGGSGWPSIMQLECDGVPSGLTAFYSAALLASYASLIGDGFMGSISDADWNDFEIAVRYANKYKPNGFARIYGDDRELYDAYGATYYCGARAEPLILNHLFYDREGAIIVGLARKQRNPWAFLLNAVKSVIDSDETNAGGVYSAFNPVDDNYIVAFSAARAAHRFHPSGWQINKALETGRPLVVNQSDGAAALPGEYETRFDSVCEEGRFSIVGLKAGYAANHVGCVCRAPVNMVYGYPKGDKNIARLSRCWNLCETDWDATLLPLRFALAEPEELKDEKKVDDGSYDSLNGQDITWKMVGVDRQNLNPLQNAAGEGKWMSFPETLDELSVNGLSMTVSGAFLSAVEPTFVNPGATTTYDAPYTQIEVNDADMSGRRGKLNLQTAIKEKVL